MKKFKRLAAAVLTAVMAVTASATALAADTGKYAQFYKASDSSAVSMVQLGVQQDTVSYSYNSSDNTYDISFGVEGFDLTISAGSYGTITGYGYITGLTLYDGNVSYSGKYAEEDEDTNAGTVTISGLPKTLYDNLLSGVTYTTEVEYVSEINSAYSHNDSTALFTLSSTYYAY